MYIRYFLILQRHHIIIIFIKSHIFQQNMCSRNSKHIFMYNTLSVIFRYYEILYSNIIIFYVTCYFTDFGHYSLHIILYTSCADQVCRHSNKPIFVNKSGVQKFMNIIAPAESRNKPRKYNTGAQFQHQHSYIVECDHDWTGPITDDNGQSHLTNCNRNRVTALSV